MNDHDEGEDEEEGEEEEDASERMDSAAPKRFGAAGALCRMC